MNKEDVIKSLSKTAKLTAAIKTSVGSCGLVMCGYRSPHSLLVVNIILKTQLNNAFSWLSACSLPFVLCSRKETDV